MLCDRAFAAGQHHILRIATTLLPQKTKHDIYQPETERPYRVYVHNDDVTPMDFVVHVLMTIFLLPAVNAAQVMQSAHLNGKAYVQTLPLSEARRRIAEARFAARLRSYPLEFSMEAD